MFKFIRRNFALLTLLAVLGGAGEAVGCPNCKFANETESNRPRAYMLSILFMIGMPATIFTGFGISFYRLTKNAELQKAEDSSAPESPASDS